MLIAAAALAMALPGAASAQAPAAAPATASPTAVATAPTAGTAPAIATSATPPAAAAPAPAATVTPAAQAATPVFYKPTPGIGQPTDKITLQPQVTELGKYAAWMNDWVLLPIIGAICLLVLVLLLWAIFRYRRAAHPTPSRTSHNTILEVTWTVLPVLVLLVIAVPSIKLLAAQYDTPKPDLTVKVIGHQWYWSYQYPDDGDFEVVSNILDDAKDKATGQPRQLGVDEHMVVPAGAVVKLIVTSDDVIHSFAVPAFWLKMDAVPGRLNETWFKVDRPGVYYGQCSELCGARHGFMPIAVEVVTPAQFRQWVASKGGTIGGKATSPDATQNSPITNPPAKLNPNATGAGTPTSATENATAVAQPANQAATTN